MSAISRVSALAPFSVRSFRFQWPADMATSWAFEMETLILGWYVLVETGSVLLLTLFASLQYIGTLLAPMFGVLGDRLGHRNLLSAMRTFYATIAVTTMALAYMDALSPTYVLAAAALIGLVRPSDMGMRAALVAETMPRGQLLGAMGIQRTTMDTARIAGALTGAGLVAALGTGPAYTVVASLYAISVLLTLRAGGARTARGSATVPDAPARASPWRELKEGLTYVWRAPFLRALMFLAFLLNVTTFPLTYSLLPYVAKEVYHTDQTGLGYMVASVGTGAFLGAMLVSRYGTFAPQARMMVVASIGWCFALIALAFTQHLAAGIPVLLLVGCVQATSQVPMASILLRSTDERYRGRVMGIRMLAIYGNIPGLLLSAQLIARFGYSATAVLYCAVGLASIVLVATHWRALYWRLDAPANAR